jgi:hypothetical protein
MSVHVVTEQHGTSIIGKGLVQDGMRDIVVEVFFDFSLPIQADARICIRIKAELFSMPLPVHHSFVTLLFHAMYVQVENYYLCLFSYLFMIQFGSVMYWYSFVLYAFISDQGNFLVSVVSLQQQ